jgi:hypothetical protein
VIQQAVGVVIRALGSPDPQRQQWASDKIMSSYLARSHPLAPARRGAGVDVSAGPPRVIEYRWRNSDEDKRDAERAEAERHRDEGKNMVSIGWGEGGKIIEHEAGPKHLNKG